MAKLTAIARRVMHSMLRGVRSRMTSTCDRLRAVVLMHPLGRVDVCTYHRC